jgi:hypothetical protein
MGDPIVVARSGVEQEARPRRRSQRVWQGQGASGGGMASPVEVTTCIMGEIHARAQGGGARAGRSTGEQGDPHARF